MATKERLSLATAFLACCCSLWVCLSLTSDECEAGNEGLLEINKNLRYLEWIHFSNNHCDSSPLAMMGRSLRYLANARLGEKLDVHTKRNLSVFLPKLQLI